MNIGDDMKKVILAGIGAMATTAEKTREFTEMLIEKGELTVEQGKIINEELKRTRAASKNMGTADETADEIMAKIATLSKEEQAALKEKLADMEKNDEVAGANV